ncbi:hypothetical protein [uncultured Lamprocystis sp.]|jgi:hypothetical protein|uniref:hypothetical protein n=1 Tax=uncultured Lamprocystis sp. TaxID=543132 RepID=UPI0025FBFE9D|nr:hypothetical protein [uncultured Lamprocystis sp.]
MTTETESAIRLRGMRALIDVLGLVEAERFMGSINRERFDYTIWRQQSLPDLSIEQIAARANQLSAELDTKPSA